jgi:hypothetical protein
VTERVDGTRAQLDTVTEIENALGNLARDPNLGDIPPGPFGRPIYRFVVRVNGVRTPVQAVYCYSEDEREIVILGFGLIPL